MFVDGKPLTSLTNAFLELQLDTVRCVLHGCLCSLLLSYCMQPGLGDQEWNVSSLLWWTQSCSGSCWGEASQRSSGQHQSMVIYHFLRHVLQTIELRYVVVINRWPACPFLKDPTKVGGWLVYNKGRSC